MTLFAAGEADETIDPIELASVLDIEPEKAIGAAFDLRKLYPVRSATVDGEIVWHRGDVEAALVERDKRKREPKPCHSDSMEFSATSPEPKRVKGVRISDAASARGMSPGRLENLLQVNGAVVKPVGADLLVKLDDLDRLTEAGLVPRPTAEVDRRTAEVAQRLGIELEETEGSRPGEPETERKTAEAEARLGITPPAADPEVEQRTKAAADALGIDASPPSAEGDKGSGGGWQVAEARPRKRRRLGQPERLVPRQRPGDEG